MKTIKCPHCGAKNPDYWTNCHVCKNVLIIDQALESETPANPPQQSVLDKTIQPLESETPTDPPPQSVIIKQKQTKFVVQLLLITLAIAALFIPSMTVLSDSTTLFRESGILLLVITLFATGLTIYGFAQNDLPIAPLLRACLWAGNVITGIYHVAVVLTFAEITCFDFGMPLFIASSTVLFLFEVKLIQGKQLKLLWILGGVACLLTVGIAIARGRNLSDLANGQRIPRSEETYNKRTMEQLMNQTQQPPE